MARGRGLLPPGFLRRASCAGLLAPGFFRPFALLTMRGDRIEQVTAFIVRSAEPRDAAAFARYPDEAVDAAKVVSVFERCGLPERLD